MLSPEEIRVRRLGEFKAVTELTGIEYETLDIPDCEVVADLSTRKRMVNYIREYCPDVLVATDDIIDEKYKMFDCHVSQVYEWLPYENGVLNEVPEDPKERLEWLRQPRVPRDGTMLTEDDLNIPIASNNSEYREAAPAIKYRDKLNSHSFLF